MLPTSPSYPCSARAANGTTPDVASGGRIDAAHVPAGTSGFGYDPIFVYPPLGCTLAEASAAKDTVSHRAQAFGAFARWLRDLG